MILLGDVFADFLPSDSNKQQFPASCHGKAGSRERRSMNSLDALREEMIKRGCTRAMTQNKTVAVVFDILSESGDKYTQMQKEETEKTQRYQGLERDILKLGNTIRRMENKSLALQKDINDAIKRKEEDLAYITDFMEKLVSCETEEGRDTMRKAQVFINSIDVDTKYDNTAYIIGLASILSGGSIGAITELKKINTKLPSPSDLKYLKYSEDYI